MKTKTKKKPQDLTLRNLNAIKKRVEALESRVSFLSLIAGYWNPVGNIEPKYKKGKK